MMFLLMTLFLSLAVIAAIVKIIKQQKHISDHELRSIASLTPSHRDYNRIIRHLGICDRCRIRMEDLRDGLDHLVED